MIFIFALQDFPGEDRITYFQTFVYSLAVFLVAYALKKTDSFELDNFLQFNESFSSLIYPGCVWNFFQVERILYKWTVPINAINRPDI